MNVTAFEMKEKNTAELTVEIEASAFNAALDSVYKKTRGQISVPGFRRGKAPRRIIENLYGASVFYSDALDELLPEVCAFGIREKELRVVGYPQLGEVNVGDDKNVSVNFSVSLYPEVEIGDYKGIRAVKPSAEVPESAIDSEIETVRMRNGVMESVDRPAINGDTVVIDYEGSVDGVLFDGGTAQGHELTLGSGSFIPGFEEQVQGMTAGEERDINVRFPDEYHAENLAGKDAVFKIRLHEVRSRVLPEVDDEFVKDVSEFDTLEEYRADIRARLVEAREKDAENWFENALLEKLGETVTGDIPEAMYEEQVDSSVNNMRNQLAQYGMELAQYLQLTGSSEAAFRADARPAAEKQVKIALALEKVVEKEKLEATDKEVEAFYAEMAEQYSVDVEVVKSSVDEESARREVTMRAAVKLVRENGIADAPEAEKAEEKEEAPKKPAAKKKAAEKKDDEKLKAKKKTAEKTDADEKKPAAKKSTAKKAAEPAE